MKLAKRKIPADIEGEAVSLLPEDPEDMWHIYNLVRPGDIVHGHTSRKVVRENDDTGATSAERIHLDLAIKVKDTSFDPMTCILRASGLVVTENEAASLGAQHALEFEPNRSFSLIKPEGWDSVAQEMMQQALSDDKNGALAAVVMHEGLANICLITDYRTVHKVRVEHAVPKKHDASSHQDAGMRKFYEKTLGSLLRAADFSKSRPLLLASPGFVAADFKKYIADQGRDKSDKTLTAVAKLAEVVHAPSGHLHSLNAVLKDPKVLAKMKDVKYAKEALLLDAFFDKLKLEDGRAWYGTTAVEKAVQDGAVGQGGGVLLINNILFRHEDLAIRNRYVALVDQVKALGGEHRILSSDHGSGQRLQMLGHIAAILTYPMLDLDEDEDEEEEATPQNRERHDDDQIDMMDSVI
ncbi:uncharacterized protein J7T54_007803 [Emericellopsis cladophorae]|uniref:Protein DOM34 homolog n=1 Tax=Emericellopsis cladophorae TaxID=2686198 RepID=A0A9P9Y828_9HYPO|nr:uncharacterized protein J7T54_007803 [Emericellopsis cladophorae]KAI6784710.1 hypothetical protein J7T54_007803 [Emericellopsis cladophorae]